jgi:microcystin-dependent protein
MPLVFRKLQNTPLSNNQLDGNFEYLRDQIDLKPNITDLTAAYVAGKLNTAASLGNSVFQTAYQLSQTNALNAWTVRGIEPSVTTPSGANKTSLVVRGESDGAISAPVFVGSLNGNATSATSATTATTAYALDATYKVPVALGGTNATTAAGARSSLRALSVESDNQMLARLNLNPSSSVATVAFGVGSVPGSVNNGDMWTTTAGFHYRSDGVNKTFAPIESPTFTGAPAAPAHPNAGTTSSQIATLSHIADAVTTLNAAVALKSSIASPQFTGIPTCDVSPDRTINNTRLATTGHVHSVVDNSASLLTTAYQTYTTTAVSALSTSVNGLLALKASLASPVLTGTPRSTTPAINDDSDRIATTSYTADALAALKSTIDGAISGLNDLINQTRPVPTSTVLYVATTVVPNGFLECNGSIVSRATYAALWQALGSPNTGNGSTTFNLPDLRGEFIRGWDHGRGIDYGRTIGSWQIGSLHIHNDDSDGFTGGVWSNMWTNRLGYDYDATERGSGRANEMGYDAMTFEYLAQYATTTTFPWTSNNPVYSSNIEWRYGSQAEAGISLLPNALAKSNHWIYMGRPRNVALMPIIKW